MNLTANEECVERKSEHEVKTEKRDIEVRNIVIVTDGIRYVLSTVSYTQGKPPNRLLSAIESYHGPRVTKCEKEFELEV